MHGRLDAGGPIGTDAFARLRPFLRVLRYDLDHALELRTRDRERKLISKINSALERIDDGEYGYCEETGEPISVARLKARPIATLSLEAQERHERMEKTQRDD